MSFSSENKLYSYSDYCAWDDSERWELIEGVPFAMPPAPSTFHQDILSELLYQFKRFLRGKPCKVYVAPFDVRLNADKDDNTVVQPDLAVICDHSKIDEKGCKGAPDLVVEIISPASAVRDMLVKFRLYQDAGVREYWIVNPDTRTLHKYELHDGDYVASVFGESDAVASKVLPGCEINFADVFGQSGF
ncbi:MAG: Uma2 family endonuclease [Clostridiales bacterium]|nr:Uma2 family endonuclease [Clostridiales bacterium]